ncbi:MAG TPA: hypothetical protein VG122_20965 [Gemmata sp.]|jgi:hypothetical protein|nr:hypothetical protein [Gemmata sp.]
MRYLLCTLLGLAFSLALQGVEPPSIKLVESKSGAPAAIEATGLSKESIARLKNAKLDAKQWPEMFRVVVAGGKPEEVLNRLPVAGTYTFIDSGIRFEPQFPFVPGREYRAILYPDYDPARDRKGESIEAALTLPKPPPGPRISITSIYPSGNRLPENTLRFYIHFSGEVARGDVYRHLKLIRDDGIEVKSPFLELEEQLWSVDGTRLTILLHPGRVKRELVPREEEGPILEEGHRYTLTISDKWEDTEGRPIVSGFRKTFTVGPADDKPVDPMAWALVAPRAGSDTPLLIRLPKALDNALLGRLVWVEDESGKKVPGTLTVGGGERVLTFAPSGPWMKGEHYLVIDPRLEDVCGNRVGEPFEVEAVKPIKDDEESKPFQRPFMVR